MILNSILSLKIGFQNRTKTRENTPGLNVGSYCHSEAEVTEVKFLGILPEVDNGLRFMLAGLYSRDKDLLTWGFVEGKSVSKSLWLIIYALSWIYINDMFLQSKKVALVQNSRSFLFHVQHT